jgi:hypothetical protein
MRALALILVLVLGNAAGWPCVICQITSTTAPALESAPPAGESVQAPLDSCCSHHQPSSESTGGCADPATFHPNHALCTQPASPQPCNRGCCVVSEKNPFAPAGESGLQIVKRASADQFNSSPLPSSLTAFTVALGASPPRSDVDPRALDSRMRRALLCIRTV